MAGLLFSGCTSGEASSVATTTSVTSSSTTSPPSGNGAAKVNSVDDLRGDRYCELLAVTKHQGGFRATVWGTQELNDCPPSVWDAVDTGAVADELGATAVLRNGPRWWTIDALTKRNTGTAEIRTLDGLEVRRLATVELGSSLADAGARYQPRAVDRATTFTWSAGEEVYELIAPDGATYVMQSSSGQIDPNLTASDLPGLASRLHLPDGWRYRARTLDDDLVVDTLDAPAQVLQDDLSNSYSKVAS